MYMFASSSKVVLFAQKYDQLVNNRILKKEKREVSKNEKETLIF